MQILLPAKPLYSQRYSVCFDPSSRMGTMEVKGYIEVVELKVHGMWKSVARWLVCHWGGKYTDCRPPPPSPTHTHTNTHAAFLSEFLISLQGRIQDFGEEEAVPTWIIDALATGRGAREAREARVNFCSARSNFSTDCIGN